MCAEKMIETNVADALLSVMAKCTGDTANLVAVTRVQTITMKTGLKNDARMATVIVSGVGAPVTVGTGQVAGIFRSSRTAAASISEISTGSCRLSGGG